MKKFKKNEITKVTTKIGEVYVLKNGDYSKIQHWELPVVIFVNCKMAKEAVFDKVVILSLEDSEKHSFVYNDSFVIYTDDNIYNCQSQRKRKYKWQ